MKQRGFTLIELLVVIGIIAVLAAIIFPVFASARGKARQIVCLSNMRQLGMAIAEYAQDADELYPYAVDPSDKFSQPWIWRIATPAQQAQVAAMPLLNPDPNVPDQPGVLTPYVKSSEVWKCPSDTGYTDLDNAPGSIMQAHPTSYAAYGSSYLMRTEIVIDRKMYSDLSSYTPLNPTVGGVVDSSPPCTEHGPSEVNVLMDAAGAWHGGLLESQKRYDVLMADGHVVNQNRDQYTITWNRPLTPPFGCPGYSPS